MAGTSAPDGSETRSAPRPGPPRPRSPRTGAPRAAAFFDLDKTVIAKSSALAFSRPFYRGGLINRRAVLRSAYAQFVYLAGGADADQIERMRKYLSSLCAGWDVQQVREIIAETLHDLIDPFIYEEAAELIEEHQLAGRDVIMVSTSGSEVVEPIGEMLGADRVIATRMAVDDEGRYTGEIEYYAYGEAKADGDAGVGRSPRASISAGPTPTAIVHRHPDALGGRSRVRREPGPGAAQGGVGARLAGALVQPAGVDAPADARDLAAQRTGRWPRPRSAAGAARRRVYWFSSRRASA